MLKAQRPFQLLTIAMAIALTLPVLLRDGMFMDATLFSAVAHNMSQGIGTFWSPQFSKNNVFAQAAFLEQPPLGFGIQSLFFRVFGGSMYVERGYTFLLLIGSAGLIHCIWKKIFQDHIYNTMSWLPVLLWITIPQAFWSFSNNMLENTMGVFILSGVYFILSSLLLQRINYSRLAIGGIFIFLATLTKGIPGLFIICMPFWWWLITRKINFRQVFISTVLLLLIVVAIYALLLLHRPARESLHIYFFDRALFRIGENPTVSSHFFILGSLAQELFLAIIITGIAIWSGRRNRLPENNYKSIAIFCLLTGICGSLPLMITLVQKPFYYVPSLPLFGLGFGILCAPYFYSIAQKLNAAPLQYKIAKVIAIICLIAAVGCTINAIGKTGRNKDILTDVHAIGKIVPDHSCISIEQPLWNEWPMKAYMMRYYNVCFDIEQRQPYCIVRKNTMPMDTTFKRRILQGEKYDLYQ